MGYEAAFATKYNLTQILTSEIIEPGKSNAQKDPLNEEKGLLTYQKVIR